MMQIVAEKYVRAHNAADDRFRVLITGLIFETRRDEAAPDVSECCIAIFVASRTKKYGLTPNFRATTGGSVLTGNRQPSLLKGSDAASLQPAASFFPLPFLSFTPGDARREVDPDYLKSGADQVEGYQAIK